MDKTFCRILLFRHYLTRQHRGSLNFPTTVNMHERFRFPLLFGNEIPQFVYEEFSSRKVYFTEKINTITWDNENRYV